MTPKNVAALPIGIATGSPKETPMTTHPIPAAALDDCLGMIFGGSHADLPITPHAGAIIGESR